jgi:hypothetical protein
MLAVALMTPVATMMVAAQVGRGGNGAPQRPEGPCDIYAAGGAPCTAAHSSTRALYAKYNGPLYQVMRQSDGKTLDIGVVQPSAGDAGGYADAAAQDAFCANTTCWVTALYDQSGKKNHLIQAPRGAFSGPAMGGANNVPIADMAPVTLNGHKVYGIFIEPGMGIRLNDAHGTAVDDQAEGQYWVINGLHYNSGCCYDYGNGETDSRDDGDGTMETTYYGNAGAWYRGQAPGPWIMSDQENNLVGCVNESPTDKLCRDIPSINWRFVTATMDGEPKHWRTMGGDAQKGDLKIMYDGGRIKNNNSSYDPMRKQGAILLGNGGDNSNGSAGTFYEGAMTEANTFPSKETNQKIQANVVAAQYAVAQVSIAPAKAVAAPTGLQTFAPGSSEETTVTFTNVSSTPVTGVKLSLNVPAGWTSVVAGGTEAAKTFADPVAPGASVNATFKVTSGPAAFNGDLVAKAEWTNPAVARPLTEMASEKVRNVSPIKVNEFANSFIELYNAGTSEVDISNWTLTEHPTQQAIFSSIKVPAGTKIAAKGFYVLGLSNSGLAAPAKKGDSTLYVRSIEGLNVGDTIEIGEGATKETRKIASVGTAAGNPTTIWQPLPEGPYLSFPVGAKSLPVQNVTLGGGRGFGGPRGGAAASAPAPTQLFTVGQKIGIGYGANVPFVANTMEKYEVVTVTAVGKQGTQAWLSANAKPGDTNIKVSSVANITAGDKIRLGYDTAGHGVEWVTVKSVGTQSQMAPTNRPNGDVGNPGTGLDLVEPLKYHHSVNMPFSVNGTGVSFEPATAVTHWSNEPVLSLGTGITLDKPLDNDQAINAVVLSAAGNQGSLKANQWFGGPAITNAGNIVLRDAAGLVADSLNFGGLVDPWAAEGYQAKSPGNGCSAPSPVAAMGGRGGRGGRGGQATASAPAAPVNRSTGRAQDGVDNDSNCTDFVSGIATPGTPNQR